MNHCTDNLTRLDFAHFHRLVLALLLLLPFLLLPRCRVHLTPIIMRQCDQFLLSLDPALSCTPSTSTRTLCRTLVPRCPNLPPCRKTAGSQTRRWRLAFAPACRCVGAAAFYRQGEGQQEREIVELLLTLLITLLGGAEAVFELEFGVVLHDQVLHETEDTQHLHGEECENHALGTGWHRAHCSQI